MGHPWIYELQQAIPVLTVCPHLRVSTIQELKKKKKYTGEYALLLEETSMQISCGKMKLYMRFVQYLISEKSQVTLDTFQKFCMRSDCDQEERSMIDIGRETLLGKLNAMKFECPEVPETKESNRACPRCKGRDLSSVSRQTRGADEEATIFYTCNNTKCSATFR